MSKLTTKQQALESKKTMAVAAVAIILIAANFVPLHHFYRRSCPDGGTYTTNGTTMGLPMSYYQKWNGGSSDCAGMYGDEPSSGFSAQALLTDALVFGIVTIGANVLLDRRTNK
jgi:hypothetical protein